MEPLNLEKYLKSSAISRDREKCRVLLIALNVAGYYSLPVRILALMAELSDPLRERFCTRYIEHHLDNELDALLETVFAWHPDIIGLSVNIWNRNRSFALARALKAKLPDTVIIAGGQEMTRSVFDYLDRVPEIDFIIDGEGEIPFQQFLTDWDPKIRQPGDPAAVSGLRYRRGGRTCFSGPALLVKSLDEIPSPILAGLVPIDNEQKLGVMIEGSRGCPFRCSFCFEGSKKSAVRSASHKKVAQELQYVVDRGGRHFHILDPILCNTDPGRLRRLADHIRKTTAAGIKLTISVEAYAENISEEIAENINVFSIIDIGLQSVNPATLEAIHRRYAPQKFLRGLECLRQNGAPFNLYLICGLPFETLQSYLHGLAFVLGQNPTRIFLNELCLLNGTELRREADRYGYQFEPDPPYLVYASNWMRKEEFQLAWAVSKAIERKYNLTSQGVYGNLPWMNTGSRRAPRKFSIEMGSQCTWNCKGCTLPAGSGFSAPENFDPNDVDNADVEIRTGDRVDINQLMRFIGRLHLGGAARIILAVPPGFLVDEKIVALLLNRGVWHFKTFYGLPEQNRVKPCPDWKLALGTALENLNHVVSLKGAAVLRPCVEISLFQGRDGGGAILKAIDYLVARKVSSIDICADLLNGHDDRRQIVAEFFKLGTHQQTWLKLPQETVREALVDIPDVDACIALLSELELFSAPRSRQPCLPDKRGGIN